MRFALITTVFAGVAALFVSAIGSAAGAGGFTVNGRVANRSKPISGARVYLQAWPNQATMDALPAGKRVSLDMVAEGRTASDGSYSLTTDLSRLPGADVNPDGIVNLRESIIGKNGWVSVRDFPTTSSATRKMENIGRGSIAPAIAHARAVRTESASPLRAVAAGTGLVSPQAAGYCEPAWQGSWSGGDYGPYEVVLGTVMNDTGINGKMTYAYGTSTSTTLGVAISYDSGTTWASEGSSQTLGTTNRTGFIAPALQNVRQRGLWYYRNWRTIGADGSYCWTEALPYQYYDKGDTVSVNHSYFSNCGALYTPGESFFRSSGKNGSYSDGLSLFGVSLMSQAGWDTGMTITYGFGSKTGNISGWVCGDTAGPATANRVEAERDYGGCSPVIPAMGRENLSAKQPDVPTGC